MCEACSARAPAAAPVLCIVLPVRSTSVRGTHPIARDSATEDDDDDDDDDGVDGDCTTTRMATHDANAEHAPSALGLNRLTINAYDTAASVNATTRMKAVPGSDGMSAQNAPASPEALGVGSPTRYFSKMLENNCSAGKARRALNGEYATPTDEYVRFGSKNRYCRFGIQ